MQRKVANYAECGYYTVRDGGSHDHEVSSDFLMQNLGTVRSFLARLPPTSAETLKKFNDVTVSIT